MTPTKNIIARLDVDAEPNTIALEDRDARKRGLCFNSPKSQRNTRKGTDSSIIPEAVGIAAVRKLLEREAPSGEWRQESDTFLIS